MEIPETKRFIPKGFELGTTLSRMGLLRLKERKGKKGVHINQLVS